MIPIWKDIIHTYDLDRSFTYDMPSKYSGTIPGRTTPHTFTGAYITDAITCDVTEELQGDYLLTMTYPLDAILADKIEVNTFIIAQVDELAKDGLQLFRIRKITTDGIGGVMTIEATHISYDTNGLVFGDFHDRSGDVTPQFDATSGQTTKIRLIGYNYFPFYSDFDYNYGVFIGFQSAVPTTARAMIGENEKSYIKLRNLEPQYDNGTTYLLNRRGADKNITLRYGRDITAISQTIDTTDCVAFLAGYYHHDTYGTYYNSLFYDGHNQWDEYCPSKVINYSSDITGSGSMQPADYRAKILELLTQEKNNHPDADQPKVQIEVSFERTDLADTYASVLESQQIRLGDTVNVYFPKLNINTSIRAVKTDYNVLLDRYNSVTLGTVQTTLATGAGKTTATVNKDK